MIFVSSIHRDIQSKQAVTSAIIMNINKHITNRMENVAILFQCLRLNRLELFLAKTRELLLNNQTLNLRDF
ncbi:MAG: hypothetical protein ACI9JR_002627 [Gammaproteobacteria bacterium]|jgi:hypothetical protein